MKNDYFVRITDDEKETIKRELSTLYYDPNGSSQYINDVRIAAFKYFPRRLLDLLQEQKASINPHAFLCIENLPTDNHVHTSPDPNFFDPTCKSGFISENLIVAISSLIGEPYSISFEGRDIVNNLVPTKESKNEYTGLGSEVELDFHIENAALKFMGDHNFSPLGLLLTGVRYDPNGPQTKLSDSRKALQMLDQKDIETLQLPLFKIKVPYRWRKAIPGADQETGAVAIVHGSIDFPEVSAVFYPDMIIPTTTAAEQALKNFYACIKSVSVGFDIAPGRLIYIDNRFTLHSRDAFTPRDDVQGNPLRWIQRVFVAPNLWNHRVLERVSDRVFQPFSIAA